MKFGNAGMHGIVLAVIVRIETGHRNLLSILFAG
jgi:hypothetical protein